MLLPLPGEAFHPGQTSIHEEPALRRHSLWGFIQSPHGRVDNLLKLASAGPAVCLLRAPRVLRFFACVSSSPLGYCLLKGSGPVYLISYAQQPLSWCLMHDKCLVSACGMNEWVNSWTPWAKCNQYFNYSFKNIYCLLRAGPCNLCRYRGKQKQTQSTHSRRSWSCGEVKC